MMQTVFSLINQQADLRFERKYWFEENRVFDWESLVSLLPVKEVYYKRQVNSLYLDDNNLKYYHAAKNGNFSRYKVRVRWYGDLYTQKTTAQLEIKFKQGDVGGKNIFAIKNFNFSKKNSEIQIKKNLLKSLPTHLKQLIEPLDFILTTVYERQYWQAYSNSLRLTIDSNLATAFHFGRLDFNHDLTNQPFQVLELKYPNQTQENKLAHQIGQQLPLQLAQFSKYAWGVERSL